MTLNKNYWEERYCSGQTGWDIGYAAPAITDYLEHRVQTVDSINRNSIFDLKILIPGVGRGHEVHYLWENGFRNLTVLDIAEQPLNYIHKRIPEFPANALIQANFLDFNGFDYNLILEQTFFCALAPNHRSAYVQKMHNLLQPGGKLAGLLFDFPLTESGPPFGGCEKEYRKAFEPYFWIKTLERANNSIPPRAGKELFFIFEKI